MNRIDQKFRELKKHKKKAFIAFLTAGYPSLPVTGKLIVELGRAGADIIEIGVPFSDPMADGPVIQESSQAALRNGVTIDDVFTMVRQVRLETSVPLCLMLYYNIIFAYGEEFFVRRCASSGIDGIIVPDLPFEEGQLFSKYAGAHHVHVIRFISPTTAHRRVKTVASSAKGFIYYISLTGVTGPRQRLPADLKQHVRAIKRLTATPVCVGFGVSSPAQVKDIQKYADGVIVGSALIKIIKEHIGKSDVIRKVGSYVSYLKG